MIRGVVFDMDDTLCLERDYVRSGFSAVAQAVAPVAGAPAEEVFEVLWESFLEGTRGRNFDLMFERFPAIGSAFSTADLVRTYREHSPDICLRDGMAQLLDRLRARAVRIGVISDGPLASQQGKAQALKLASLVDEVILTDQWGPEYWKPHPRSYQHFMQLWGFAPETLVYIGDNPLKDFAAPNRLGWRTVFLDDPEQLRHGAPPVEQAFAAQHQVSSVAELAQLLQRWTRQSGIDQDLFDED